VIEVEAFRTFTQLDAPCAGIVRFKVALGEVVAEDDVLAEFDG
jgi:predicted deacylase